jgi:hypothetical protein
MILVGEREICRLSARTMIGGGEWDLLRLSLDDEWNRGGLVTSMIPGERDLLPDRLT